MSNSNKKQSIFPYLVLLMSLVILAPRLASAKTLYVDGTNGDNTKACTAPLTGACTTITAALQKAANGDTIQIAAGIYAETLTLTINVTLQGETTGDVIIDGQQTGVVITTSAATLPIMTLRQLTIQNGAGQEAGGVSNFGAMTVDTCIISNNKTTAGSGGGINNRGSLQVRHSTISGNTAAGADGGILNVGTLSVEGSTLTGNTAQTGNGGGIDNQSGAEKLSVINSTITGNTAFTNGGGVSHSAVSTTLPLPFIISNITISDNSARNQGGNLFVEDGASLALTATIVARASNGGDCSGGVNSQGDNIDTDGSCGLRQSSDQPNTDPASLDLDTQLQDNGGPTQTLALLAGSPALDRLATGPGSDCPSEDQRDVSRPQFPGGRCDIGAFELESANQGEVFVDAQDGNDGNSCFSQQQPCRTIGSGVQKAHAGDTIMIAVGSYTAETLPITLDKNITLQGASPGSTAVDGRQTDSVFVVNAGTTVTLQNLTIQNGKAVNGGGVLNHGALTLSSCIVRSNTASFQGGGIATESELTILSSTLAHNTAQFDGALAVITSKATLTNSTLSSNIATASGGAIGIVSGATTSLNNGTVAFNTAPNGSGFLLQSGATLQLYSTIVANTTSNNCSGTPTSQGYNLDSDGSYKLAGTGDLSGQDPKLETTLNDNGGPTSTHKLLGGSPAANAGNPKCPPPGMDQRGVTRPQGDHCTIGAVDMKVFDFTLGNEGSVTVTQGTSGTNMITATLVSGSSEAVTFSATGLPMDATASFDPTVCTPTCTTTLTITTAQATPLGAACITVTGKSAGDLTQTTSFTLTVQAPVDPTKAFVNGDSGNDANTCFSVQTACKTLGAAISKVQAGGTVTIAKAQQPYTENLILAKNLTLQWGGSAMPIIDGGGKGSVFIVNVGVAATLDHLIVQNGKASQGGGIVNNGVRLTLSNCTVQNNTATDNGGGIVNTGVLTIGQSFIQTNTAGGQGGGIFNKLSASQVTVNNSVVSKNQAASGGGIYSFGPLTLAPMSTVGNNKSTLDQGGGIVINGALLKIDMSVITNNTAASDGSGIAVTSGGTLSLTQSVVVGNKANCDTSSTPVCHGRGGGIFTDGFSRIDITQSTVQANLAAQGGGVFSLGLLKIVNSTISSNTANQGGGVYLQQTQLTLSFSTIANNTAPTNTIIRQGSGVFSDDGTVQLTGTIVANTISTTLRNCHAFGAAQFISKGYNLDSDGTCGLTETGDKPKTNPQLGVLKDNGGTSTALHPYTHALLANSPALKAGGPNCPATDERGFPRPIANCDSGAYQTQSTIGEPAATLLTLQSGKASGVGRKPETAKLTLTGSFPDLSPLDLGSAIVTLNALLVEGFPPRELVGDLPLQLAVRQGGGARGATYESARDARPKIRLTLRNSHPGTQPLEVTMKMEKATIAFPQACTSGKPSTTTLLTEFTIDDGVNSPVTAAGEAAWECIGKNIARPRELRVQ